MCLESPKGLPISRDEVEEYAAEGEDSEFWEALLDAAEEGRFEFEAEDSGGVVAEA